MARKDAWPIQIPQRTVDMIIMNSPLFKSQLSAAIHECETIKNKLFPLYIRLFYKTNPLLLGCSPKTSKRCVRSFIPARIRPL